MQTASLETSLVGSEFASPDFLNVLLYDFKNFRPFGLPTCSCTGSCRDLPCSSTVGLKPSREEGGGSPVPGIWKRLPVRFECCWRNDEREPRPVQLPAVMQPQGKERKFSCLEEAPRISPSPQNAAKNNHNPFGWRQQGWRHLALGVRAQGHKCMPGGLVAGGPGPPAGDKFRCNPVPPFLGGSPTGLSGRVQGWAARASSRTVGRFRLAMGGAHTNSSPQLPRFLGGFPVMLPPDWPEWLLQDPSSSSSSSPDPP